jgi:glc operon protein GlcG
MSKSLLTIGALCVSLSAAAADAPPPPAYGAAITLDEARRCVAAAQAYAVKHQWLMVMTVVDSGGHVVLTERMDNAQFGSLGPALKKAHTAVAFRRPTKVFEDIVAQGGAGLRIMRLDEAMPIDGGLPLLGKGRIIGAIGVSGGTSAQDGEAAAACVTALTP